MAVVLLWALKNPAKNYLAGPLVLVKETGFEPAKMNVKAPMRHIQPFA
jgi:hypothetical protein